MPPAEGASDRLAPAGRWPKAVVGLQTGRHAVRSGAVWGVVFGGYVAVSAYGYAASYKTPIQRAAFARTFGDNVGINAIIGPAHAIGTVAGFTAWRSLGVLSLVGAVWGLLAGTRLLRGEEEAGRWELLLAGQTTRSGATRQALAGLVAGLFTLWALTAILAVAIGRSSEVRIGAGPMAYLAAAVVSSAGVFLAVGALASQLAATRRQAAAYAGAALGVAYALRMVADSGAGLDWMRWTGPLGWVEELRPLASPRPLAFLPLVGLIAVLASVTVHLARLRDLGASTIPDRPPTRARTRLLGRPEGLALRMARPVLVAWMIAIALLGVMMGMISKTAGRALSETPSFKQLLTLLGSRHGGATTYLGVAFLVVAVLVSLVAAGQINTAREEEAGGRLDNLLVRPVSRMSWLGGRLTVATMAVVLSGVVAGFAAWIGAASQGAGVDLTRSLAAGVNVIAPALFILGIGTFAFGVRPRQVTVVVYAVLAWSFLVEIIGGIVKADHWVLDTSIFYQMAAAPAVDPNWMTDGVLVSSGLLAALAGAAFFRRRDLVGD